MSGILSGGPTEGFMLSTLVDAIYRRFGARIPMEDVEPVRSEVAWIVHRAKFHPGWLGDLPDVFDAVVAADPDLALADCWLSMAERMER